MYFCQPTFDNEDRSFLIAVGTTHGYEVPENSECFNPNDLKKIYEGYNRPNKFSWLIKAQIDHVDIQKGSYICDY